MVSKFAIGLISLILAGSPTNATLTGTVVAVQDGDNVTVQRGSRVYKVRLAEVDAPEMSQVFGKQAREFVESLALGKRVQVNVKMIDRHGRRVGEVIVEDGRVLNEELVFAGLAWHYRVHPLPNSRLQKLEQYAFSGKLGLWVEPDPVPPWEFRRESAIPKAPKTLDQVDYDRIIHYGILGDRSTGTLNWPACRPYRRSYMKPPAVFASLQQAKEMGYRPAKSCPR